MDENSCVDEASKSTENAVKGQKTNTLENTVELKIAGIAAERKASKNKAFNTRGSFCDVSGTSTGMFINEIPENEDNEKAELVPIDKPVESSVLSEENEPAAVEPLVAIEETVPEQTSAPVQENSNLSLMLPNYENGQSAEPCVRIDPCLNEQLGIKKVSIGPPPSYSFVMKQKKKSKLLPSPDLSVIDRPPLSNNANNRELMLTPQENQLERVGNFPSFEEPVWRAHSQQALCPRCGLMIVTTTHSHDSVATHVAALGLCLFGCWPCCLIPYCINVCKNTYHHCPICQGYLGLYTPCAQFASEVFGNRITNILPNSRKYSHTASGTQTIPWTQ